MALEIKFSNNISAKMNIIASSWLGFLFIILVIVLGYDIIRLIPGISLNPQQAGRWILILTIGLTGFGLINANFVRIRKLDIPSNGLKKKLRIVHLSDLHIGSIHGTKYLEKVVRKTKALNPDLVLITGDLADGPYRYTNDTFKALDDLEMPVYFTTGNHEYYAGFDYILNILNKTKLIILRNEKVDLGDIQLVGIDDNWDKNKVNELLKNLKIDPNKFTVLMYHRPTDLEMVNKHGVNLILVGHTHGGQFLPFILFAKLIWKRFKGLYKFKDTYMYTTTGAGTWGPPLRLGTNSEITMINLGGT
jgi:predicted MPP superfamily phosphohydrolase